MTIHVGYLVDIDHPSYCSPSYQSMVFEANGVKEVNGVGINDFVSNVQKEEGLRLRFVDLEGYKKMYAEWLSDAQSTLFEINSSNYNMYLEMLPPYRWSRCFGVEVFCYPEEVSGGLHHWFAEYNKRWFRTLAPRDLSLEDLVARVKSNFHR
ncbi:hypothetical protein [Shewanella sp. Iso12]|uniref:hypothetical protein n=1 Tax=Shewanella sp. Iso12 TaxID=1826753 RepID=UPI0014304489|nr:hypothetical protein [Shewanella sp. Iso12]NJI86938.1 hypothetical protein [Shewanella sp. Iso12]